MLRRSLQAGGHGRCSCEDRHTRAVILRAPARPARLGWLLHLHRVGGAEFIPSASSPGLAFWDVLEKQ